MPILSQVLGTTRSWQITAISGGRPVTGVFGPGDPLAASVFAGEGQAVLLSPTVAWIDPAAGTIQLTITADQTRAAALAAGTYHLQVIVTPTADNQPRAVFDGLITFTPAAGVGAPLPSYVTIQDMSTYAPQIEKIQDPRRDLAGFATERHAAYEETQRRILNRYRPQPGRGRRYVDMGGTGPGPYLRFVDTGPGGVIPPTYQALGGYLSGGNLILNRDLVEFNARLAVALVFEAQIQAGDPRASVYAELGKANRQLAEMAWNRALIEIASAGGVTPDLRIDRDVVWLT